MFAQSPYVRRVTEYAIDRQQSASLLKSIKGLSPTKIIDETST
jgi:hypothetical protein